MCYQANPIQQMELNDRFLNLSERDKKILMGSWAKQFAEWISASQTRLYYRTVL